MAGVVFMFMVVLNCMLFARCSLWKPEPMDVKQKPDQFSMRGVMIKHRQIENIIFSYQHDDGNTRTNTNDFGTFYKTVQHSVGAVAYQCTYYTIADVESHPVCTIMQLNATTTITNSQKDPTSTPTTTTTTATPETAVVHFKPHQKFPSHFKGYDLTRLSVGCTNDARKYITNIYLPWQAINVFSDKAFTETEVENMYDSFYDVTYTVTKIFNISRPMFLQFIKKIPVNKTVFVIDDQDLFYKTAGKPLDTCWLYGYRNFYVNKNNKCGPYRKSLSVLYSLFMNDGYLIKGAYGPYWWKMGLCYYSAGYCFENLFRGKSDLTKLFHMQQENPEEIAHGSILHGFLDSTPELRMYHRRLLFILNRTPTDYHQEYNALVDEIVNTYGDTFNKSSYCQMYNTYDL